MATAEQAKGVSGQAPGVASLWKPRTVYRTDYTSPPSPAWSLSPISSQAFSSTLPQLQVLINSAGKGSPTEPFLEPKGGMR